MSVSASAALRDAMDAIEDRSIEQRLQDALYRFNAAEYARAADDLIKTAALLRALNAVDERPARRKPAAERVVEMM